VVWPWLFGAPPSAWQGLLSSLPIALLLASAATLPTSAQRAAPQRAAWLLLLAFPCALGVCMAIQPEAVNRLALGPLPLTIAVASLVAYGAASLSALGPVRHSLPTRVRAVVTQPWDVPATPTPRLQTATLLVATAGAMCIALWAPAWGGMTRARQHWGESAVEGALLTQVVGAALGISVLAVLVGGGVRSARSPDAPPSLVRAALLLLGALLGGAVYQITRAP